MSVEYLSTFIDKQPSQSRGDPWSHAHEAQPPGERLQKVWILAEGSVMPKSDRAVIVFERFPKVLIFEGN